MPPNYEDDNNLTVNGHESDTETISFTSTIPDCPSHTTIRKSKVRIILDNVTIEPLMFLQMFATASTGVIVQNMYIDRICTVTLNNSQEICDNLTTNIDQSDNNTLERHVDGIASTYTLYRQLIETIIPVIFALFLGPWSDRHGNKFPLLLPIFGYILSAGFYTLFSFLPQLPPAYILISSIPVALSGGMVAIVLSSFSFISALTTNESRSFRIAVLEACWFLGMPIGLLSGAAIYKAASFAPVFLTAATLLSVGIVYGIIFIQEEKPEIPETANLFADVFNVQAVKETFYTVFAKRDGPARKWILLLIACVCLRIMTLFGPMNVMYLFVRNQFGWNEQQYTTFTTVESLLGIVGGAIVMVFAMKMYKLEDTLIGLLSSFGFIASGLIIAFASPLLPREKHSGWIMYVASVVQMFGAMATIVTRSLISKVVPKQELGKIFTFVAAGEASVPILASALYTMIFKATEESFPAAFFLLTSFLNCIILFLFIYFHISIRKNPQLTQLQEDQENIINN